MDQTSESQGEEQAFRLELPMFEGPLDLLLHLIQTHELDVLDLPITFITEKYLAYLELFEQLNLDLASEYLVMAATLAHIKSKMLLPPTEEDADEEDDEPEVDPREELVRRLLEYQKYKAAAEDLASRGLQGRDVFLRGSPAPQAEGPAPLGNMSLFSLMDAFQRVLKRANADFSREISAERVTIQERISELVALLESKPRVRFEELFEGYASTYDYVVTFLAMLEMAKTRLLRIYQSDPYSPIYLEKAILDEAAAAQAAEEAAVNASEPPPAVRVEASGADDQEADQAGEPSQSSENDPSGEPESPKPTEDSSPS